MGEFKHLVVAKFKEDVLVEDIIKGMQDLVLDVDLVKSFEWGEDIESHEMLRQGFTHSFLMTFNNKDDFIAFMSHPKHAEFSTTFSVAIDKVVLLDFSTVLAKPIEPPKPDSPATEAPAPIEKTEDPAPAETEALAPTA